MIKQSWQGNMASNHSLPLLFFLFCVYRTISLLKRLRFKVQYDGSFIYLFYSFWTHTNKVVGEKMSAKFFKDTPFFDAWINC